MTDMLDRTCDTTRTEAYLLSAPIAPVGMLHDHSVPVVVFIRSSVLRPIWIEGSNFLEAGGRHGAAYLGPCIRVGLIEDEQVLRSCSW